MTLMRYTRPRYEMANKRFSDIMDEFFYDAVNSGNDSFVPSIDVSETEEQFLISAELPGMTKENININLENGRLTISGERTLKNEEEGKTYHRVETKHGSFSRSFQLPDYVDEESINAGYSDGLLNISINKAESKVKRQIEIK